MPHSAASDLGLHCLTSPVCSNTQSKYGTLHLMSVRADFQVNIFPVIQLDSNNESKFAKKHNLWV